VVILKNAKFAVNRMTAGIKYRRQYRISGRSLQPGKDYGSSWNRSDLRIMLSVQV
jgi:hypothetical protein